MLKYSTSRSKPGWGKPEYRPIWWPEDVPWANVRSDVRSEEQKKKVFPPSPITVGLCTVAVQLTVELLVSVAVLL